MKLNTLKLSIPPDPVPDIDFQQRDGAPQSVSSDSLPSPVSQELVNEGLEMLLSEFHCMKMKLRPAPILLPASPALFPGSSPMPSQLSYSSSLSPFPAMPAPLSAGFPHSMHSPHPGYMISPMSYMPPMSAMLPRRNEQVFFGQNFDGRMFSGGVMQGGMTSPMPMTGQYPQFDPMHRVQKFKKYSKKVFIGGIPAGTKSEILVQNFSPFGKAIVDWPKKLPTQEAPPSGYAFVVFENESSVCDLLLACVKDGKRMFYNLVMPAARMTPVEIKVWTMADTTYTGELGWRNYRCYSVFLGGLPRTCSAASLAQLVEKEVGKVAYCIIETDRINEYPKGAGCIVFQDESSYRTAIAIHQLVLKFDDGVRKVEMKPFIANDMQCKHCSSHETKYCKDLLCLAYYCDSCWKTVHSKPSRIDHVPMKRGRE